MVSGTFSYFRKKYSGNVTFLFPIRLICVTVQKICRRCTAAARVQHRRRQSAAQPGAGRRRKEETMKHVTNGFELFMKETQGVGPAMMEAINKMSEVSALDQKVHELAYISVLVATKMYGGLPFHMDQARRYGATTEELRSAVLLPMPVVGIQVAEALPYLQDAQQEEA